MFRVKTEKTKKMRNEKVEKIETERSRREQPLLDTRRLKRSPPVLPETSGVLRPLAYSAN